VQSSEAYHSDDALADRSKKWKVKSSTFERLTLFNKASDERPE
jgi:hypothetical protein